MKIDDIKLNTLSESNLPDFAMNMLRGGVECYCSCYWEGNTGSLVSENAYANFQIPGGGSSEHGCNEFFYDEEYGLGPVIRPGGSKK